MSRDCDISSHIGRAALDVPTPALLLDLDAVDHNIALLAAMAGQSGIRHRPHAKGHKCLEIAHRQIAQGAVGICCQKLSEAEIFAAGGIKDILVTNEIVSREKLERAVALARTCKLTLIVDSVEGIERLASAAGARGQDVDVLIELDLGQSRCGVPTAEEALALAVAVEAHPCLHLKGVQAYQGKLQHVEGWQSRREAVVAATERLRAILSELSRAGHCTEIVTGGGTGTLDADLELAVLTEVQPGSYVIMDAQYRQIGGHGGGPFRRFRSALFVATEIISARHGRAVLDAGLKSLSCDAGVPVIVEYPEAGFSFGGDEHGIIDTGTLAEPPRLGDRLTILPGHCDTTVNLFDCYHVIQNGRVIDIWPIDARGRTQ